MIMGRPWLRAAKVKQDWGADQIVIRKGKKKVKLKMTSEKILPNEFRPMLVETVNMVPELLEDEEEEFLNRNPSVIPVFEVDIDGIVQQYVYPKKEGREKQDIKTDQELDKKLPEDLMQVEDLNEEIPNEVLKAVVKAEKDYEEHLSKTARVKEDDLEDFNLGTKEDPKNVRICAELPVEFKLNLQKLLQEFKDVFAWQYTDMKGVDPRFCQHKINLKKDVVPVVQRRYRMNPNFAKQVKEEIDKLLKVGFIYPVHQVTWLSPIVIVPKKNGKIRVYVDYRKLNAATLTDPFPLPFCDTLLDAVAGHEIYSFLDGFSGYNQVLMAPEDRDKTAFVTEWGVFASNVMTFGLKNAPPTFQKWVQEVFEPFLTTFMRVF